MTAGPVIRESDRVLAIGFTGSGKSLWIQAHVAQLKTQVLIIDIKGDIYWRGAHANVYDAAGVKRELKRSRVVRYVPSDPEDQAELEKVFQVAWETPGLTVWLDESIGPTGPNTCPKHLRRILVQGRSKKIRVFAGAQRPVGFTPWLRTQADHFVIFAGRIASRDLLDLSLEMGYDSPRQLRDALQKLNVQYGAMGKYAHLHFERATGQIWARPPLPAWMLKL